MKKVLGFIFLFLLLSVSLIAGPVFSTYLVPDVPNVSNGSPNVDGIISDGEWAIDPFAPMYEAGDSTKTHLSDLYLQYDCLTSTLFVLVLDIKDYDANGELIDPQYLPITPLDEDNAWLRIVYDSGQGEHLFPATDMFAVKDGDTVIGYEAFGVVNPPDGLNENDYPATFNFQAHIQYIEEGNENGATSSTGKPAASFISMELNCEFEPPEVDPPAIPEPATMILLGFGLIGLAGVSRKKIS